MKKELRNKAAKYKADPGQTRARSIPELQLDLVYQPHKHECHIVYVIHLELTIQDLPSDQGPSVFSECSVCA